MKLSELFKDSAGKTALLSGNEAFARGIFESGVKFAANYPGTPLSEVGDHLKYLSETSEDFTFDYSLNEKVALESCIGASWAGVRSVVMFKHLGLNVAADPLHTFPYSGVNGGMLILCGGDPGILSSTNAQDNRLYSLHTKIPIIEPATVQECKDFIKDGLRFSELYQVPVYINVTTRLCHSYGIVTFGDIKSQPKTGFFKKEPTRYINTLNKALTNQKDFFNKISQIAVNKKLFYLFNQIKTIHDKKKGESPSNKHIGIITSGICYSYVIQACRKLNLNPPILKLGLIFPIHRAEICDFANKYDIKILLVIEELEPFIEALSKRVFCNYCDALRDLEIHGKDFIPNIGELSTDIVIRFLSNFFEIENKNLLKEIEKKEEIISKIIPSLPIREPTFCAGCAYRPVYYTLKKVVDEITIEEGVEFIYGGDIGCYTLGEAYPFQMIDWVICMGAGLGISNGLAHAIDPEKQKIIAFIGDSTFFHSGIQPFLNALKNNIDITIIIFNNYWTSMTGQQEFIATPKEYITHFGSKSDIDQKEINLVAFVKSLGIEKLTITDAYNLEKLERTFLSNLKDSGTKVIIINEECTLEKKRRLKRVSNNPGKHKNTEVYYKILDTCVKCNECIEVLGCPAINAEYTDKEEDLIYYIDEAKCVPEICPGICKSVCRNFSIKKTTINPK